jgi:hypothetical protein
MNAFSICFAYLDANTGSMLLQLLLGGLGGLAVASRLVWRLIRGRLLPRRRPGGTVEAEADSSSQTQTQPMPASDCRRAA